MERNRLPPLSHHSSAKDLFHLGTSFRTLPVCRLLLLFAEGTIAMSAFMNLADEAQRREYPLNRHRAIGTICPPLIALMIVIKHGYQLIGAPQT